MIKFIQPCFIYKSNEELISKLEKIGYVKHPAMGNLSISYNCYLYCGRGFYSNVPIGYEEEIKSSIDCGDDEKLFLAIAALRNDTNNYQWFTDGNEWRFITNCLPTIQDEFTFESHKATVKELIEHFRNDD